MKNKVAPRNALVERDVDGIGSASRKCNNVFLRLGNTSIFAAARKKDNLLITPMLHSTPNITQPSDEPCEKAPVKAFCDQVVKNTPPYFNI